MSASGGLSSARLARIPRVLQSHVDDGTIAGAVALVCRREEVHVHAVGARDRESGAPMQRDTIFRIASMTKPVAAVGAMILVEDGRVRLDDPIDKWVPEMADRKVLRRPDGPLDDTVPARRAITLRDLLTMRMGLGVFFGSRPDTPLQLAIDDAGVAGSPITPPFDPDELIARYAKLPLAFAPGERWVYHNAYDVLAVLVARVAKQPLDVFLGERIFGPLGMEDTAYAVPESKALRLATCYQPSLRTGALLPFEDGHKGRGREMRPGAATGLFSTVDDYLAFGRMMRGLGRDGAGPRILARPTVEAMITDQITPEQKASSSFFPPSFWDDRGWGFGVSMITARSGPGAVPGRFGWDGGLGTTWFSDRREEMVAILMTQRLGNPLASPVVTDFVTLAYQTIDD
jgi:CubicO group peptidase (beta-lactamase class C family)